MTSLRVLHATVWYPTTDQPSWGSFVHAHVRAASKAGADPAVVHLDGTAARTERCQDPAGVPVLRVPYRRGRFGPLGYPSRAVRAGRLLARAARQHEADLIHAHVLEAAVPALLGARMARLPVVVSEHFSAYALGDLTRLQELKARLVLPRVARVTAVSRSLASDLERTAGVEAVLIRNVVEPDRFRPLSAGSVVPGALVLVGRLVPVKQVDVALEALAILRRSESAWHLAVVGEGPLRAALEAHAVRLGVDRAVTFTGPLEADELASRLRYAALAVVPSRWETNSVVALEAMLSGTPVVASDVGGLREIVTDRRGSRVPPGDARALAAAIATLGLRPDRVPSDELAALRSDHSPAAVGSALRELYEGVLPRRSRHGG